MNKKTIFLLFILSGCGSPAQQMTPQQISMLSNEQLCQLKNSYPWEQNTEIEIGRRNLNCDPAYNECIGRGNKPNTPAMAMCINQLRENWAMKKELEKKDAQLKQQQIQNSNQAMWDNLLEKTRKPRQQIVETPNGTIIQQY